MSPNREPSVRSCPCPICQDGCHPEIVQAHAAINQVLSRLHEAQRRWFVGMLSLQPDAFTDRELAQITGLDPKTIRRGRCEVAHPLDARPATRQRQTGGGRPTAEKKTRRSRL